MSKWTEEQLLAINSEGKNIIVSAGAGSGKTAVLSERVLRKINDNVPINRLLILTFTNEAAKEMKDRIRKKLINEKKMEQLSLLEESYITTFDSYSLSIVKKYHYLLNVSKDIKIIDDTIISNIKDKFIDEIFEELYEEKDDNFLKLIRDFCLKDDKNIKEAILNISKKLDLKIDISTTDCILTSYTVFILSNIIAFFIKFTNVKINLKNFKYMINPLYVNQKILNIKLDCIITTNLVHIISILYKNLKKWRCDVDGNETSNRWSYGNCDEQYKRNDRCKYNNRRSNTSTK